MNTSHGPVQDYFTRLLGIDNPSTEEAAIRTFIQTTLLALDTRKLIDVMTLDDIGNLFVRLKGDPSNPAIMFCAHMDSVPPCRSIQYIESVDEEQQPILQAAGTTILGADDIVGARLPEDRDHRGPRHWPLVRLRLA